MYIWAFKNSVVLKCFITASTYVVLQCLIFSGGGGGGGVVAKSCPTCDPTDCSPPGFSDHRILQARILEWGAISFPRGSSDPGTAPRSPALQADSLLTEQ